MESPEFGNDVHHRITAEHAIAQSEAVIEEVQLAAAIWELKFEEAKKNLNREQLGLLANEAIADLDELWGEYMGERFLIAGKWIVPGVEIAGEESEDGTVLGIQGFVLSEGEEEVFDTQYSYGFGLRDVNGRSRFGFVFTTNQQDFPIPYLSASFNARAFALPEEVSLTLIRSLDEQEGDTHKERIIDTLELYDRLIQMCFSGKEFTKLTHKNQQKVINNLVQEANELITAPGVGIFLECETSDVYARTQTSTVYGFEHLDSAEIKKNKGQAIELEGILLGVGVLEQSALEERPLRTDNDFIDRSAGICLILEVENDYGSHTLYVPYMSVVIQEDGINIFQDN